jgi:hypothetical protein
MPNDGTIKNFTAIDIEKYHKGQLSAKEMYALEKAALDDPFLADALEGYTIEGVNASADIAELKKRLFEKQEKDRKVIPIATQKSFPWLRAAAMFILIAGAALLVYQFGFNKQSSPLSNVEQKELKALDNKQSAGNAPVATQDSASIEINAGIGAFTDTNKATATVQGEIAKLKAKDQNVYEYKKNALTTDALEKPSAPIVAQGNKDQLEKREDLVKKKAEPENDYFNKETITVPKKAEETFGATRKSDTIAERILSMNDDVIPSRGYRRADNEQKALNQARANVFRGQVLDAENNFVPFANITNTEDNIGTYTDAKGNFILTSPDTVLNVQVRSLGYENNNVQLHRQAPSNHIIMKEDRSSLNEVLVSNKKVNSVRSRTSTMVLDEPEPVDGWTNYDAYLANNLNIPETFKTKQAPGGEVKLSFEVNKNGQPINITVDKSLCESCDKEAIRLVKEGPKWKRKSRKGRTTVTVAF